MWYFGLKSSIWQSFYQHFIMFVIKISKSIFQNRLPTFLRKVNQKFDIMNWQQCRRSTFATSPQMSNISSWVILTSITIATLNQRAVIIMIFLNFNIWLAFPSKERTVTSVSCRKHAIKHINSTLNFILRCGRLRNRWFECWWNKRHNEPFCWIYCTIIA